MPDPSPTPSSTPSPMPMTPPHGAAAPAAPPLTVVAPPGTVVPPITDKDKTELAKLEAEYTKLKATSDENTRYGRNNAETMGRKGDVSRAITALKRKYRLA